MTPGDEAKARKVAQTVAWELGLGGYGPEPRIPMPAIVAIAAALAEVRAETRREDAEVARAYRHTPGALGWDRAIEADRLAVYSNGTCNRIAAAIEALGGGT